MLKRQSHWIETISVRVPPHTSTNYLFTQRYMCDNKYNAITHGQACLTHTRNVYMASSCPRLVVPEVLYGGERMCFGFIRNWVQILVHPLLIRWWSRANDIISLNPGFLMYKMEVLLIVLTSQVCCDNVWEELILGFVSAWVTFLLRSKHGWYTFFSPQLFDPNIQA